MSHLPVLEIEDVSHGFGNHRVLHEISLKIIRGQIVGLVGPSGCGKSTLLRAIVGTHPPDAGKILVYSGTNCSEGKLARNPGRDRGIVYQHYSLFPFMTARENVAFGLMLDQTNLPFRAFHYFKWRALRKQHLEEADVYLEKVGLAHAANLYPSEMSGGMQQRAAIAQALIMKPEILLLDEPFGALDESMREELQRMLLTLYQENCETLKGGKKAPYTILIVTHELNEALYVGDRIIGLSQYWDWKGEGYASPPGATIVYDQTAPVFRPDEARDNELLSAQRADIRASVFNPDLLQPRGKYCTFWEQIKSGNNQGILAL